ncbi:redoxin domain-containing protein [Tumebacillus flagellatus]|uniref:Thiol-disulfide oxidoreductase n=1 Tax=Tumebacillus flagellatus TaxID=1157490 RepID=A0A074LUS3_9BACL|nr:redoxin domain-containing protein [Tumebacillus flagellatus]KEO84370.1 thiol-disulfide oxidoreductase [Tumebacillus flagellatus]
MSTRSNLSRNITILVLLLAAIGIMYSVFTFTKKDPTVLEVGQAAPDFQLETLDGKTVKLSDYRGKVVLLNFWASWCEPCRQEMPDIEKAYETYKDQGLVVLGANLQENNVSIQGFTDTMGLTFPILMDKDGKLAVQTYKVKPIPTSFYIDKDGILRVKAEQPMTLSFIEDNVKPLLAGTER